MHPLALIVSDVGLGARWWENTSSFRRADFLDFGLLFAKDEFGGLH